MELHVIEREGRKTVVLLDNEMRIVKPVYDYLKFQRQKDKALNTLKASGSDLRTYWEFLNDNGYEYDKVTPKMIAEFIDYLRASDDDVIALNKESKRTNKTINRILSTIHMFYQFEADMQEIDNPILMHDINRPFNAFKGILEHAKSDNKTKQSIFKVKESDYKINLVTDDEMELFLSRLDKRRDILLYKMLYLTGARIQEVLDLEIDSVPLPDMSQLVGCFRQIKSKGKTRDLYVPMSLIKELDDFIMEERNLIDTDHSYIFVSEQKRQLGKQLTYRAAYDKLKKVQKEIGIDFNFHDLRHPYVKHTTKIFSLRLMDFQAQAYPDARRKTRGACQLLRVGQSRSPVRPLCNRKRFSCLPPQSKMSWILYAISMRLSGYTSTRSISSSASSVVSVSASKIALDASMRLSCRACSSCFCFACANTAA